MEKKYTDAELSAMRKQIASLISQLDRKLDIWEAMPAAKRSTGDKNVIHGLLFNFVEHPELVSQLAGGQKDLIRKAVKLTEFKKTIKL